MNAISTPPIVAGAVCLFFFKSIFDKWCKFGHPSTED